MSVLKERRESVPSELHQAKKTGLFDALSFEKRKTL
jgi:hypothetical protein